MKEYCILRYNNEAKSYRSYKMEDGIVLNKLPRIGEKIVYNIDGITLIAEVIDVHHEAKSGGVDIVISKEQLYADYKRTLDLLGSEKGTRENNMR